MRNLSSRLAWAITCASVLSGCATGYDRVLFATRSNLGVDLDAEGPVAEIGIARSEGVIAPTFEEGKALPVSSSFSANESGFSNFLFGVGSTFATGEAAVAMSGLYNLETAEYGTNLADGKIIYTSKNKPDLSFSPYRGEYLTELPRYRGRKPDNPLDESKKINYLEPGEVKPVFFGTDTVFGLKVAWSNPAAPIPRALKIGFNRKELAWAPVSVSQDKEGGSGYIVSMPSLLATLEMSSQTRTNGTKDAGKKEGKTEDSGDGEPDAEATKISAARAEAEAATPDFTKIGIEVDWMQYFATGRAATNLSMHRAVREAMIKKSDPTATKIGREIAVTDLMEQAYQHNVTIAASRNARLATLYTVANKYFMAGDGTTDVSTKQASIRQKAKDLGLVTKEESDGSYEDFFIALATDPQNATDEELRSRQESLKDLQSYAVIVAQSTDE